MPITILLIDDNAADAGVVKRLLSNVDGEPYVVLHELDADAGMDAIKNGGIDCAILDYQLGSTTGVELLKCIRGSGDDVPVIAYTGVGSEIVAVEAMKIGAEDYLVKGQVDSASLHRALTNSMEKVSLRRKMREQKEELVSFVGMVAHDLRSPLRHIQSFARILGDNAKELDEDCQSYLNILQDASKRATNLVDRLLDYTRFGRSDTQFVDVDLNEVLKIVLLDLSADIEQCGAIVELQDLPTIKGDFIGLGQLFQNLVGNGIKYNESETPTVRVTASKQVTEWNISVADNGIGIDSKYLADIFRPLRRLHSRKKYDGTGLGLATAAKIVEQHGGRICAKSTPNEGSTFHVVFPSAVELVD